MVFASVGATVGLILLFPLFTPALPHIAQCAGDRM